MSAAITRSIEMLEYERATRVAEVEAIARLRELVGLGPQSTTSTRPTTAAKSQAQRTKVRCEVCKQEFDQRGLGPHMKIHERAATLAAKPAQAATVIRLNPSEPLGHCSCGKEIADADAWANHNKTIPNPVGHRLIRRGEAS